LEIREDRRGDDVCPLISQGCFGSSEGNYARSDVNNVLDLIPLGHVNDFHA